MFRNEVLKKHRVKYKEHQTKMQKIIFLLYGIRIEMKINNTHSINKLIFFSIIADCKSRDIAIYRIFIYFSRLPRS